MGQILVRQLDDASLARLKARAVAERTSVEALAREAIHRAAGLSSEQKQALVREALAAGERAKVPGATLIESWRLIREDRDR